MANHCDSSKPGKSPICKPKETTLSSAKPSPVRSSSSLNNYSPGAPTTADIFAGSSLKWPLLRPIAQRKSPFIQLTKQSSSLLDKRVCKLIVRKFVVKHGSQASPPSILSDRVPSRRLKPSNSPEVFREFKRSLPLMSGQLT